jgi:predicted SprT family Zn-dependent metalloprotease
VLLFRRRKLGGTVSIVGSDLSEETVSKNVPPVTPATKSKPLRAPLRERTNTRISSEGACLKTEALELAWKTPLFSSPGKKPEKDYDDDKLAAVSAALMLLKEGVAALRTAGTDPKQELMKLFATKDDNDASATASLVVTRLVDALDACGATRRPGQEVTMSASNRAPVYIDASVVDNFEKDTVATALSSSFRNRDGAAVFVSSPTIAKIPDIVDEAILLSCCADRCKTESEGRRCDPSRCLAQTQLRGPFILPGPGTHLELLGSKSSMVSSEVAAIKSERKEMYGDHDSECDESVVGTEVDREESVTDTASEAGTDCCNTDEGFAPEEAEVSLVGSPFMSPGPEVINISDLDTTCTISCDEDAREDIVMSAVLPQAMSVVSMGEEEDDAPGNRRVYRERRRVRIVHSDNDDSPNSDIDTKGMFIQTAANTPKKMTLPSVLTMQTSAGRDIGGKKKMLRIKSATRASKRTAKEDTHKDSVKFTDSTAHVPHAAENLEVFRANPKFALEKSVKISTKVAVDPPGCSALLRNNAMVNNITTTDHMRARIKLSDNVSDTAEIIDESDDMAIITSNSTGVITADIDESLTSENFEVVKGSTDPYDIDKLRTPTPPPQINNNSNPGGGGFNSKTPKCTGKREAGFATDPPPVHSKALSAAFASAAKPGKRINFSRHKSAIAQALYDEFNADAFDGRLPPSLEITWNAKLLTTAGLTHYKKITRSTGISEFHARIELSTKVLDSAEKLEATLLHEMCHVAAWVVDHCAKPPHGAVFKRWATKAMRVYPVVTVDTCHSYQIHQPFKYRCTQSWCQQEYGRHSKSIDVEAKACGVCNGRLEYIGKFNSDGTQVEEKMPTAFSLFVKEHFGSVKERLPAGTPHKLVMKELSMQWKSEGRTERTINNLTPFSTLGEGMRALKL